MRVKPGQFWTEHPSWRSPQPIALAARRSAWRPILPLAIASLFATFHTHSSYAQPVEPPQSAKSWQQAWSHAVWSQNIWSQPVWSEQVWAKEVWAGADVTKDAWLLYSGITLAPFSDTIHTNGLRLRAAGGYGQYHYTREKSNAFSGLCGNPGQDRCGASKQRYNVDHTYYEALVGYQHRVGELTSKAFVGVSSITHAFDRQDFENAVSGHELGIKGVVELWLNVGSNAWTSLDLSYSTAHETAAVRSRVGWRPIPTISIGPELRIDGNAFEPHDQALKGDHLDKSVRGGAFARYEWFSGEVSLAGGYGGNSLRPETDDLSSYGTVNMLLRY